MGTDAYRQLAANERRELLEQGARVSGIDAAVLEKDYWVTWTLARLFVLPEFQGHLTFKGGTSLSKAYRLIARFSEDVDVSIHREFLGFGDEHDPERAKGNEQKRRLDALQQACGEAIRRRFVPALTAVAQSELGGTGWSVGVDVADAQTVLFAYPSALAATGYVRPVVRIEMGARSDHWPQEQHQLRPMLEEHLPAVAGKLVVAEVGVLSAERTFWEKATLLHAECHRAATVPMPERYARHYYDLAQMAGAPVAGRALANVEVWKRVVAHKTVYFRSAWARHDLAVPGSFRLVPSEVRFRELERDYRAMRQMIFGHAPTLVEIIKVLQTLEQRINGRQAPSEAKR
jgi:hypothetical protein